MVRVLAKLISQAAKAKGAKLAQEIDYSLCEEDFRFALYNSACLGCRHRICPPRTVYSPFQHKFVLNLCGKYLKRCPARPIWQKWVEIHASDNKGVKDGK